MTQPALSRQIRSFEESLGWDLFDREGKSIRLTRAGSVVLQEGERIMKSVNLGLTRMVQEIDGAEMKVGYAPSLAEGLIKKAMSCFTDAFPKVRVSWFDCSTQEMWDGLESQKLDLILEVATNDPRIRWEKLSEKKFSLAVSSSHEFSKRRFIKPEHLDGPEFFSLHNAFEEQYNELFSAVDEIAERIRAKGALAPGGLSNLAKMAGIEEIAEDSTAEEMVLHLAEANEQLLKDLKAASNELSAIEATLDTPSGSVSYVSLAKLADKTGADVTRLPHTVKILLENIARRIGGRDVSPSDVKTLAHWPEGDEGSIAFMPARVLMQDFTGVPAVVDLAAMRSAVARAGGDPQKVNPYVAVDLVIDHSVQVDRFGNRDAYAANLEWEYHRNRERYALLNWAQQAFKDFRVVPPGMGICHQVNLEHLGQVTISRDGWVFPDTLVGTDSHTPMINGLGVLGWGVGGIEAEAAMLGQPMFLPKPIVIGVRTIGKLPPGTTATDLVLTLTQKLRTHGVVGKFVEFFGSGLSSLSIADRATLSNMSPEFGATATLFPVDEITLKYLRLTGRGDSIDLVERYSKKQRLFRTDDDAEPNFSEVLDLDLGAVVPSVAGPKRPQDRVNLADVTESFQSVLDGTGADVSARALARLKAEGGCEASGFSEAPAEHLEQPSAAEAVGHGSVVIAAITSCTNTSNPSVMIAAGLLAKKAVEAGLQTRPWVKTSLAPGSRVVTRYLDKAGLTPYLEKLGFNLVGYGCTTCIGNSGPLPAEIAMAVDSKGLAVAAVLSGNRNFEGRIHGQVKASYLASPPLCVAYALTGTVLCDIGSESLGLGKDGEPVYLKDIWPTSEEIAELVASAVDSEQFSDEYGRIFEGDEKWKEMPAPTGTLFDWAADSTYVREPDFFRDLGTNPAPLEDIAGARALAMLGDSITTDHISPAGAITANSPAGKYLIEQGVPVEEFNSFGSRRGNHEVMIRGTFGNIRLRNTMVPGSEGPWTVHVPSGEKMSIHAASIRYQQENTPLVVIAGREYGSGSSRDWAAKGAAMLGIKAIIAEGYERIHRSNLVCMGVLPLQFKEGDSAESLGLDGTETFSITGIADGITPRQDEHGEALTRHFYERMFRENPEVSSLFNASNQAGGTQQRALAGAICAFAANVDNLEVLGAAVERIAQKHAGLRILPEHYPIVGSNLLASICEVLSLPEDHEIIVAWGEAYGFLADILIGREKQIYSNQENADNGWSGFRNFKIIRKVAESDVIDSFYLAPEDGSEVPSYNPGQYITVRVPDAKTGTTMRNYSLSSAPNPNHFRISVKAEPGGAVSNLLHGKSEGDLLEVGPPCGEFFLDLAEHHERPLVLLSAGVGITPLLAILESVIGKRPERKIVFIHGSLHGKTHAFADHVREIAAGNENVTAHMRYSEPSEEDRTQNRFDSTGFIDAELIESLVPGRDCDYFFCGPKPFMTAIYRQLLAWGIPGNQCEEQHGAGSHRGDERGCIRNIQNRARDNHEKKDGYEPTDAGDELLFPAGLIHLDAYPCRHFREDAAGKTNDVVGDLGMKTAHATENALALCRIAMHCKRKMSAGNNELTDGDYRKLADFRYELRRFLDFSANAAICEGLTPQQHQALLAIRGNMAPPASVGYLAKRLRIQQRLNLIALAVGLVSAVIGIGLLQLIHLITNLTFHGDFSIAETRADFSTWGAWAILVPAGGGLIIGLIARYGSPAIQGHGIPEAMHGVILNRSKIPLKVAILKPLSTALSIGTGGPFGAEGPVIATGGAIGSLFGQWLPANDIERKILLSAGAAAGMTAVFGTPLAGVLLAVELLLFEFRWRSLMPVALAVGAAMALRGTLDEPFPMLPLPSPEAPGPLIAFGAVLIGIVGGTFSVVMTHALHWIEELFEKIPLPWMWFPMIGGLAVGLLAWIDPRVLGAGYFNLRDLLAGEMVFSALLALLVFKFLAWSICLGSGTAGGTLAPVMTMGGCIGAIVALGLHQIPAFEGFPMGIAALVGMAAVFAGASRAFLTSVAFSFEATHSTAAFGPLLLGCAFAVLVSRILMKESIMTEKLSRKGVCVPSDYEADPLSSRSVASVMISDPLTVPADMRVKTLLEKITGNESPWNRARLFPVVDAGKLVAVVSRADVLEISAGSLDVCTAEIANTVVHTVYPEDSLAEAAEKMITNGIGRLPVISSDDGMSFHMDIVPSIPVTENRRGLLKEAMHFSKTETALAEKVAQLAGNITDDTKASYPVISNDWLISNSEGYALWFEEMSEHPLASVQKEARAQSQLPAIQLLLEMGWEYLPPAECDRLRGGRLGTAIFEPLLADFIRENGRFEFKGREHVFTENAIATAVEALKSQRATGATHQNESIYDLLCLGTAVSQTVDGDTKSFNIHYIDWKQLKNNRFHCTAEFRVERVGLRKFFVPDIVLFVNGLPLGVIECKRSAYVNQRLDPMEQGIEQLSSYQKKDGIPQVFLFSQLLMVISRDKAEYGTIGTPRKFWSVWREDGLDEEISHLLESPLKEETGLLSAPFSQAADEFRALHEGKRTITTQDRALYALCRPSRLLDLTFRSIVFDNGVKKIARYQQYFTIQDILSRVLAADGREERDGGVVWHTQGSGKSLTMVMLAKALMLSPGLLNPKVILVTDRIDLDDQICGTFRACGLETEQAKTGKHLVELLQDDRSHVVTTLIHKFEAAARSPQLNGVSRDTFVLIDEGHRGHYAEQHSRMRIALQGACFIAFTGTPLARRVKKNTFVTFGAMFDPPYTISRAVEDKAVLPLVYEARHVPQRVDRRAIDGWFEKLTSALNDEQRADLKRKFSSETQLNKSAQKVKMIAHDVSVHYAVTFQGTGLKGQLVAPNKATALLYKDFFDEFGIVATEVLISSPTVQEGESKSPEATEREKKHWEAMMDRYGSEEQYNKQLINAFKKGEEVEIIIVVDKLLTGFDAPCNTVLYLARKLKDHTLLQAIARVNRLHTPIKEQGFIMDYTGVIEELDEAIDFYTNLAAYDDGDLAQTVSLMAEEIARLPADHSLLWDLFPGLRGHLDHEVFEERLRDEERRAQFYERFSRFARSLATALSSTTFLADTEENAIKRYKADLKFFQNLRASAAMRFQERIDFSEYEPRIQKLLDTHVAADEIVTLSEPINLFDAQQRQEVLESEGKSTEAKADTIAAATQRVIEQEMDKDPAFYTKFSKMLRDVIDDLHMKRIKAIEALDKIKEIATKVATHTGDKVPRELVGKEHARRYFGLINQELAHIEGGERAAIEIALQIRDSISRHKIRDWRRNEDAKKAMRVEIDDLIFDTAEELGISIPLELQDKILDRCLDIAQANED
eukprot:g3925.t1